MPCVSDYMEPTAQEIESRKIAKWLLSLKKKKPSLSIPEYTANAAGDVYGNRDKVHELTEVLCTFFREHADLEAYLKGLNLPRTLRFEMLIWWENHRKADEKRIENEKLEESKLALIAKLQGLISSEELELFKTIIKNVRGN